jgi:hypothetical protein
VKIVSPPHPVVRPERRAGHVFATCATAFVAAALIVAIVHAALPITRGWWLVAYLALVGGLSQALLGNGLLSFVKRTRARGPGTLATAGQLALWNGGTVLVAVADLGDSASGLLTGSALLLGALSLFATSLRRAGASTRRPARRWIFAYTTLLVFLAGSVVTGAGLAGSL